MNILWQSDQPLKPAQVRAKLTGDYAYTTIMTVLKRMADKKLLERQLVGKCFYYSPVSNKNQFVQTNLKDIYGELVESYGSMAISQFVDVIKTNRQDLELLKEFLNRSPNDQTS